MNSRSHVEPGWEAVQYGHAVQENVGFDIQRQKRQEEDERDEKWLKFWLGVGLVLTVLLGSFSYVVAVF